MFKKVTGTKDILPQEVSAWQILEEAARTIFSLYNYQEIRTPILEEEKLFNRSLGESTEIIQKQMFLIRNDSQLYALRPEGTAAIVRAYLENNLDKIQGLAKFYYTGPMFRKERPQKGRLREFHHLGCEVIGSNDYAIDIEIISLANDLLTNFGIKNYKIKVNSLGCLKDKDALTKILHEGLKNKLTKLCPDCQRRLKQNTLRILDCKEEKCKEAVSGLKMSGDHLCQECQNHFNAVKSGLDSLKIKYEIADHLVRGLDYYTKTVFEISHPDLGSQDALGAGGRYDNLVKELGGPDLGAIGFAFGIERLLLTKAALKDQEANKNTVYLINLGEKAKKYGIQLLNLLRRAGISCDTDYENKSLKGAMRKANDIHAKAVLILGDNELEKNTVTFKDMVSGNQEEVQIAELIKKIKG